MPFAALEARLSRQQASGLWRQPVVCRSRHGSSAVLDQQTYLLFGSNDYLGLAQHPELIQALQQGAADYGVGAGAAHLISGHFNAHQELTRQLAAFVGKPRALLFSTGYMANLGVVQALVGRGDTIFADKLNHASLNDAMRLSRALVKRYSHNDMDHLEAMLAAGSAGQSLIMTDAVFSMDGDQASLPQLLQLAERYDAWLLVDDAHGFGVLGPQGNGSLAQFGLDSPRIIYMATLGKAAGVSGAFVAAETVVTEAIQQFAAPCIYTTASPPALAVAVSRSLQLIARDQWRRDRLQQLTQQLKEQLSGQAWTLMPSETPIQPLLIGTSEQASRLSQQLRQQGIWVNAIRPPTVPAGQARLRITLSAAHSAEDVTRLTDALRQALLA